MERDNGDDHHERAGAYLARALHTELAVTWDAGAPERSVADLFDQTLQHIPTGDSGK